MPYINTESRYKNTVMREIVNNDGDLKGYDIAPVEGYVLHNKILDYYEYDPETKEDGDLIYRGYSSSSSSVPSDYDFNTNPSEIYAIEPDKIGENDVIY